ncbi:hypothetical protein [Rhodoplanes sp. Z2-YC6860]|uniref:hypothetical protein n=1 Tax=Rhodoplanes sp. Z2-YC6860 TaxID=674703 RepID=UPI0012EDB5B4|nr:hypothetical protein [Rhodoplanes sp. Z2-YC6860]
MTAAGCSAITSALSDLPDLRRLVGAQLRQERGRLGVGDLLAAGDLPVDQAQRRTPSEP